MIPVDATKIPEKPLPGNDSTQEWTLDSGDVIQRLPFGNTVSFIGGKETDENIVRLSPTGRLIWRVRKPPSAVREHDVFLGIYKDNSGRLYGFTMDGFHYRIDIVTGSAEQIGWNKN